MHKTRAEFLKELESSGKNRYKRYKGLPLRYAGGKSLAIGHVVEALPHTPERIVSPFFGGGSVEIACANELGVPVKGYDVFGILANYWQVQLAQPRDLAQYLRRWTPTKEKYQEVRERLGKHWRGEKVIKNPVTLAAHYWFNHNLSYGPGFLGWMSSVYADPQKYIRRVNALEKFSAPLVEVEQGNFEEVLPHETETFLYCDPPYYLDGDSKMFRGIYPQRNFPVHHDGFDHAKLRDLLMKHKGGFVLSYNDCSQVREWYTDCDIREVRWQYTMGQGETRMGKNRLARGDQNHTKQSHELLIVGARHA